MIFVATCEICGKLFEESAILAARCKDCGISSSPNVAIENPLHYNSHPSGIECITIAEHFNFNIGNAIKYIWRAGLKSDNIIQDLEKAMWYLKREIENRKKS